MSEELEPSPQPEQAELDSSEDIESSDIEAPKEESLNDSLHKAWDEVAEKEAQEEKAAPELDQKKESKSKKKSKKEKASIDQTGEQAPEAIEPISAPAFWSEGAKTHFNSLPREVQQLILEEKKNQDRDYTQKTQKLAELRRQYEDLDRVLTPHQQRFALNGVSPAQLVNQYLAADEYMRSDPANAIRWLAQSNGIDLRQLLEDPGQAGHMDPHVQQLNQQIQELRSHLDAQKNQAETKQLELANNEVHTFAGQKDEFGRPLRPWVQWNAEGRPEHPEFYGEMLSQLAYVRSVKPALSHQKMLEEAYDRAIRLYPPAFEAHQKGQRERELAEAKKASEEAKKKILPKGVPINGASSAPIGDLRAALESAWDELS